MREKVSRRFPYEWILLLTRVREYDSQKKTIKNQLVRPQLLQCWKYIKTSNDRIIENDLGGIIEKKFVLAK